MVCTRTNGSVLLIMGVGTVAITFLCTLELFEKFLPRGLRCLLLLFSP